MSTFKGVFNPFCTSSRDGRPTIAVRAVQNQGAMSEGMKRKRHEASRIR